MEQSDRSNHWQRMFDREKHPNMPNLGNSSSAHGNTNAQHPAPFGYDDGPAEATDGSHAMSPEAITDAAAMALALAAPEYRPWILQRGRSRPVLMLHLRRFDPKSRLWSGWAVAYPHLIALEYTGDHLLSLDFGERQFMLEGDGFGELVDHLQTGHVICVQEYAPSFWSATQTGPRISAIRLVSGA